MRQLLGIVISFALLLGATALGVDRLHDRHSEWKIAR